MIQTPPFIDLHTHTRYPDNNSFPINEIEDAAINGGYSDVLAMANSEIPIDSIANLNIAREFDEKLKIKIHRVGALTENLEGKNLTDFKEFIEEGITIFSDDGKSLIDDGLAENAFKEIGKLNGAIFQHCEKNCHTNPGDIAPPNKFNELITIHENEESEIIRRDLGLVKKFKTRYHVQHLSSKKSVELIKEAKENNLPVTAEVTPHHLLRSNLDINTNDGSLKMYPPLRSEEDRQALIEGLKDGIIDVIATDHAPHPSATKEVSFKESARGVVGLESAFVALFSSNIFTLDELICFMSKNPQNILKSLGYDTSNTLANTWIETDSVFNTKSFFKNSAFENLEVKIKKEFSNV